MKESIVIFKMLIKSFCSCCFSEEVDILFMSLLSASITSPLLFSLRFLEGWPSSKSQFGNYSWLVKDELFRCVTLIVSTESGNGLHISKILRT